MKKEYEIEFFAKKILNRSSFFENDIKLYNSVLLERIKDKTILVIGGAGTIGSNYIKEILVFKPSKLVVVDINENGLTELTRDLRNTALLDYEIDFRTYPISLNDKIFDKLIKKEGGFEVVANFSAHKHVRTEKDVLSIEALIRNNVFGAIKLLELLKKYSPNYFFSVSTDKAANPVNIMGASKCLMEKIIISYKNDFHVSTARFANVAFSNGSLLESFVTRIDKNQPLSCPLNVKRFFVTPEESGQICLLSTFLGNSGTVFFPKFDFNKDQILLSEIALSFIKHLGLKPIICSSENEAKTKINNREVDEYPILLLKSETSGEKPYEEFYTENENYEINNYNSLGVVNSNLDKINIVELTHDFENIFKQNKTTKDSIVALLKKYIDNFNHIETGRNLDQKM